MNHMTVTYGPTFEGLPIMANQANEQGCFEEILRMIKGNLDRQLETHNKVFVVRFDLRFPSDMPMENSNHAVSVFHERFTRYLRNNGADPKLVWVREQSREKHQHYHCMLIVDGNKHQAPQALLTHAEKYWGRALGADGAIPGLVDHCKTGRDGSYVSNCYNLRRSDPALNTVMADCFRRCSYMAKVNTKENRPKELHSYGGSRC